MGKKRAVARYGLATAVTGLLATAAYRQYERYLTGEPPMPVRPKYLLVGTAILAASVWSLAAL